jgi:polyferredoxin
LGWGDDMKLELKVRRKIIQIIAFGYSNIHVTNFINGKLYKGKWKQFCNPGMNCYSCPAATLSCPIGAIQAVNGSINYSFSFYVVGFILAAGVLFGRAICGFVCPFGLIQEILHRVPFPKKHLKKGFTYIKYFMLIVFVLVLPIALTNSLGMGMPAFCEYICPVGTLEGGIPLIGTHPELRAVIGKLFGVKMLILLFTIIGSLSIHRFFCRVMCPLGAIYGILNKISFFHMEHNKNNCISCGKCKMICPMEVNPVANPNSAECIRCGKCVENCPRKALGFHML